MFNNCVIEFDGNEYGTYFTGQKLTGKIIITLNKPKNFKGIKLQVNGYAQCQWRERHGRKKPLHKINLKKRNVFFGHEDYIASSTFLVGSEGGQNVTIDSGTHTYTFACPIPIDCPSSYEGTFGHIRYLVKVTFIRSASSSRTYNRGFTVLKFLDLNKESSLLKSPASMESFENYCFFGNKTVYLRVDITQTGYVPGQMVLISVHVNNKSKADVRNILITLNLRAHYIADIPGRGAVTEKLGLVKKYCGPVAHYSEKNFAEIIRVPATPPSCDHLSKVVHVSYEICVKAIMNYFMSNPKAVIPITIGNKPLVASEPQQDNVPTTSRFAMHRSEEVDHNVCSGIAAAGDDSDLPPPTYEEAMFMTTNLADDGDGCNTDENVTFTPRYPVYDIDSMIISNVMVNSPPPNPPQKCRKRRSKYSQS